MLPIITVNVYFYQRNSIDTEIREIDNLQKSIDRTTAEFLALVEAGVALSQSISNDAYIYRSLDKSYNSIIEYYDEYHNSLRGKLEQYAYVYPDIKDIRIYTDNPTIQPGSNYYLLNDSFPWLQSVKQAEEKIAIEIISEDGYLSSGAHLSIVSKMNRYSLYSKYSKYIRIDLNMDKIHAILNREKDHLELSLFNDSGQLIASSNESVKGITENTAIYLNEANSEYELEGMLTTSYLKGWRLMGKANNQHIKKLLNEARNSIISLALISTVIPTVLIFVIFQSYHYRVKKLHLHMKLIQKENFSIIEINEGRDEIGSLIQNYNAMISKITSLINEVYKLEIRQKSLELERVRAELNMLHSQMNPHFLFNTLNALFIVSTKNGYSDIAGIIQSLSLLMRQLIKRADGLIPLQEELQFTTMYLQIEKFRFGERFDYKFEIDDQALKQLIPQMSIQPLVENACKHGLNDRRESRTIVIKATYTAQGLEIIINDNGRGITKEKLNQLLQDVRSQEGSDSHIGMRNVYRRLKLYYGESVDFFMDSKPGIGTMVGFRVRPSGLSEANKG